MEKSKLNMELKYGFDDIWTYCINKVYNAKLNNDFIIELNIRICGLVNNKEYKESSVLHISLCYNVLKLEIHTHILHIMSKHKFNVERPFIFF
jgi:hypothetical protein